MKNYRINIDMPWSKDIIVNAKTLPEAKKKAWAKFIKKLRRSMFKIDKGF